MKRNRRTRIKAEYDEGDDKDNTTTTTAAAAAVCIQVYRRFEQYLCLFTTISNRKAGLIRSKAGLC
jgi:hypothetical protein